MRLDNCPHCAVSMIGNPIPSEHQEAYGGHTHFRRDISVEVLGDYDGGLYMQCPDCLGKWHRWPEGHYLRARAEKYVGTP